MMCSGRPETLRRARRGMADNRFLHGNSPFKRPIRDLGGHGRCENRGPKTVVCPLLLIVPYSHSSGNVDLTPFSLTCENRGLSPITSPLALVRQQISPYIIWRMSKT